MDLNFMKAIDISYGGNVIILVGPPGAGKTAMAEKIIHDYDNFVIVSPDTIRTSYHTNSFNQVNNSLVFAKVNELLVSYLNKGYNVIYDATNCRTSYRYQIINTVSPHAYKLFCLVSGCSMSDCLRRNAERDIPVPEEVVERMYLNLRKHPPTLFEGYDMVIRF